MSNLTEQKNRVIRKIKTLVNTGNIVKVQKANSNSKLTLWLNNNYIMWQYYGQSAIKNNIKELTWLINTLFESKGKEISCYIGKSIYSDEILRNVTV